LSSIICQVLALIISILVMVYVITDMTLDDSAIDQIMTRDYVLPMINTLKLVCCFKHLMTWFILFDPPMCRSAALCVCIGRHWVLQAYKCIVSDRIVSADTCLEMYRYRIGAISAVSRAP
jgi:hypothetical protein